MATRRLGPVAITRAVRAAGSNDDLTVLARKIPGGYTVTIPAMWTAMYLGVHPEQVNLRLGAERLSAELGVRVDVSNVRAARSVRYGRVTQFDVALA